MTWRSQGLVFSVPGAGAWLQSHAQLPTALHLGGDRYRVYFASRDAAQRSRIGYVELDVTKPRTSQHVAPAPVLDLGPLGHFDDHGVFPASVLRHEGKVLLYYIGWIASATRPVFYAAVGLAASDDDGLTFRRQFKTPILDRNEIDPWMVTSPCVMLDDARWRMWYVSGLGWERDDKGALYSRYHVKYAESADGIGWQREGLVSIDLRPAERNIARPSVIKDGELYRMWYSYNTGEGYRIGYAESHDGQGWKRRDSSTRLPAASDGWDASAQAYPHVLHHGDTYYMLYNGNDFGREGFGLAMAN